MGSKKVRANKRADEQLVQHAMHRIHTFSQHCVVLIRAVASVRELSLSNGLKDTE